MSALKLPSGRGRLVAEFFLIVVGVLVALAVETALEDRQDQELRDEYIERIGRDMAADQQALEHRIEFFADVQVFVEQFHEWLDTGEPLDKDTVLAAFYSAEVWPFVPNQSTYRDLQNTGNIRLIDNIDLRTSLANYHNRANSNLSGQSGWTPTEHYRQMIRGVIPSDVQDLIRNNCPTTSALHGAPTGFPPCDLPGVDYEEIAILFGPLKADAEFRRRLTYRHSELGVVIYLLTAQIAFADDVLTNIENL